MQWHAIVMCATFRVKKLTGKLFTSPDSVNIYFTGLIVPFGATGKYHPISAKDKARLQQIGKKVLPGIFTGYTLMMGESGKETLSKPTQKNYKNITPQEPM